MAKIILKVGAELEKTAESGFGKVKSQIDALAKSLNNVKANKEFTEQLKALTQWNKSLADAVKKTTDATIKQTDAELKQERYRAKTITDTHQKIAQGEEKIARERIKNAQETTKLQIEEQKLEQQKIKTAKAQKDEADAARQVNDELDNQSAKTKNLVDALMQWSVTSKLIHSGLRLLRTTIKDVNETLADTEKRIIAIQRVLPEGSVGDKDLSNRLYDLAIEYGQSFANVSDIATNFARTGLSYADTIDATRAALLALNVAELDSTQATDGLIAVMAQFELQASDLNNVIDKLNKTADRYPVTTEKLMSALQRMGSSASLAGLGLDETIGIATALSKATGRSGANIGTAANALIQYSTKGKALDIYSQLSPEVAAIVEQYKIGAANVLDIWKALSKEIDRLTFEQSEKLDVLAEYFETGEGAGLKEQMEDELGDIFNDITGVFSTANTFRKNYFVALLKEMGTVEEAAETARDSMGYSIAENEKEMQTYQRRVQALEEHWHKLANDEQGFLAFRKGLVETGDVLLTVLEYTGGLRTASIALGSALTALFGPKIIAGAKTFLATLTGVNGAMSATLGWVGAAATLLSVVIGAVQKYKQAQHEANLETIEAWKQNKESTKQLSELYDQYQTLNPESKEFRSTEEQIVQLLGEKAGILSYLTKGTKEYTEALKHLTEEELNRRMHEASAAAGAAGRELANTRGYYVTKKGNTSTFLNDYAAVRKGVSNFEEMIRGYMLSGDFDKAEYLAQSEAYSGAIKHLSDNKEAVDNYLQSITAQYLSEFLASNGLTGLHSASDVSNAKTFVSKRFAKANGTSALNSFYEDIYAVIDSYARIQSVGQTATENQERSLETIGSEYSKIASEVEGLLSKNQKVNEELEKQKALEEAIAKAKAEYIKEQFESYLAGLENENTISEKQQSIEEARAKIEEARLAVAEKRQAVKEAEYNLQKAQDDLEYAKNKRSERVFNSQTGMWEYQANKKSVADAQEKVRQATEKVEDAVKTVDTSIKAVETAEKNVQKAVDSLTDYLKKQAIAEIKAAIAAGDVNNEKVKDILVKWFGDDGGGTWGTGIQNAIATAIAGSGAAAAGNANVISAKQALANVQQDQFYNAVTSLFQGGGKVSADDLNKVIAEYKSRGVFDDAISAVRSIVSGYVSNWRNVANNGIISGAISGSSWANPTTTGGSTNNTNNYVVNGVPIEARYAKTMTLEQIFTNFDLVH